MAAVTDTQEPRHKIEARLHPNAAVRGAYVARAKAKPPLTIADVCAAAKRRGSFAGRYEDLAEHAHVFINEVMHQLLDGNPIHLGGFCSLYASITGNYHGAEERIAPENLRIAFREMRCFKGMLREVVIENAGVAGERAAIDKIIDLHSGEVNRALTRGYMVHIVGNRIRVEGDAPDVGVWFVPQGDGARVKLEGLGINRAAELVGTVPALEAGSYKIEVVTYFSGGGRPLKMPRVITGEPELTVA